MAKIIGNTTATPNPKSDYAQTDATKADYIKNKPIEIVQDSFKLEYGIKSGYYLLRKNAKVLYYTMGENLPDIPAIPFNLGETNYEWKEIDYQINSDTLMHIGATVIDEVEKIKIPITFLGEMLDANNNSVSILKCYLTGYYPGSSAMETGYEISYEIGDGVDITVDSEMSDDSKNPVQNKIVKKYVDDGLLTKVATYKKNTTYHVGDWVIGKFHHPQYDTNMTMILECKKEHISSSANSPTVDTECWTIYTIDAFRTSRDGNGNIISETYLPRNEAVEVNVEQEEGKNVVRLSFTEKDENGLLLGGSVLIPTYTSDLENDAGFLTQAEAEDTYATKEESITKLELWQPNKSYKKNAWVRGLVIRTDAGQTVEVVADLFCLVDHTSPKVTYPYQDSLFKQHWEVHYNPTAAACDKLGRDFTTEYVKIYDLYDYAKLEKVYDHSSETSIDLIIRHNELYYFDVLTNIVITMSPDVYIDEVEEPFTCSIVFKTGDSPTVIVQDGITITWSGDDVDEDGVFSPETNKTYEISIKKLGLIISARVGVI